MGWAEAPYAAELGGWPLVAAPADPPGGPRLAYRPLGNGRADEPRVRVQPSVFGCGLCRWKLEPARNGRGAVIVRKDDAESACGCRGRVFVVHTARRDDSGA